MRSPGTAAATACRSGTVCGCNREKLPTKIASMGRLDAGVIVAQRSSKPRGTHSEATPKLRAVSTIDGSAETMRSYPRTNDFGGSGDAISPTSAPVSRRISRESPGGRKLMSCTNTTSGRSRRTCSRRTRCRCGTDESRLRTIGRRAACGP
jgi:hypothetical protein